MPRKEVSEMTTFIIILLVAVALLILAVWSAYRRFLRQEAGPEFPQGVIPREGPDGSFRHEGKTIAFEAKLAASPTKIHERQKPPVDQARLYNELAASVADENLYADLPRRVPAPSPRPESSGRALPAGRTGWKHPDEAEPEEPIFEALKAAWEPQPRLPVRGAPPWKLLDSHPVREACGLPVPARAPAVSSLPRETAGAVLPGADFPTEPRPSPSGAGEPGETASEWLLLQLADLRRFADDPDAWAGSQAGLIAA